MGSSLPAVRDEASEAVAANCIELAVVAGSCKWFPPLAKLLSANKPAAALHYLTDEPERTCYEWARGKFDPPARVLLKLLHTDQGWRVLEYLMRGCHETWWSDLCKERHVGRAAIDAQARLPGI